MLFNSHVFLFLFLPLTWGLYTLAARLRFVRMGIPLLAGASFIFYGFSSLPFLAILLLSIGFNFLYSKQVLKRFPGHRLPLILGVALNLALLGYFKYTNFLLTNVSHVFGSAWHIEAIALPIGISFFTFQQIAYLVDCHRGATPEGNFWHYALFVSFFPQLIAGPIVHHKEMMPQFSDEKRFRFDAGNMSSGLGLFSIGLFKKVVIADSLSPFATGLFDGTTAPALADAWLGTLCYTLQIYFDFSGYSEMAIGLGLFFNIDLPVNFNSPYQARNIVEFWRRWHITLSRFLKDYLYIPLGGSRHGTLRRYTNLMITMLLGGLWHGANWTFVLWGLAHGLFLCTVHVWDRICRNTRIQMPIVLAWALTFLSVSLAWVLFRSPTLDRAIEIYTGLFGGNGTGTWNPLDPSYAQTLLPVACDDRIILVAAGLLITLALPPTSRLRLRAAWEKSTWVPVGTAAMFVLSVLCMTRVSEFLYFQF